MKHIHNITTLLLAMTLALLLSACNTKTTQDENNTAGSSSPTTQTTEDTSATGSGVVTGGATQNGGTTASNSGTTTSSGGSSNTTGGSNNNATHGNTNTVSGSNNSTIDSDSDTGTGTESNSTQADTNATTGGEETNTTTGGGDDNTTTTPTVTLKSLNLTVNKTSLNKDENTTVKVVATYSDNATKEVTDKVEWVVVPNNTIKVTNTTLTALQDKATTLKAKLKGKSSNAINLNITWTVNGHTLPPEPDKALNDSTLLGIDTNNNGVRDDVERWIYKKYDKYIPCTDKMVDYTLPNGKIIKGVIETTCEDKAIPYHPIVRAIAMQGARAAQIIIQEPEKARETMHLMDAAQECGFYFGVEAYSESEAVYMGEDFFGKAFDAIQFNTVMRARAYGRYNFALSGGVFDESSSSYQMRNACDFNVDNILGK